MEIHSVTELNFPGVGNKLLNRLCRANPGLSAG
jgi:hypothetical protein